MTPSEILPRGLTNFFSVGGASEPFLWIPVFIVASGLMIHGLGALERKGFAGTALGTLVMPYCSGFSNLAFAYVMGRTAGRGDLVLENCLVNNVTNLTLLLGLSAFIWPLCISKAGTAKRSRSQKADIEFQMSYLALLLTIVALLFFTGTVWALGRDGHIDCWDGAVLVGLFLFWQVIHVFEVLKGRVRHRQKWGLAVYWDLMVVAVAAGATFASIEQLVDWVSHQNQGLWRLSNIGWLSGFLMVLPNAFLAFYYASRNRADIVYSSQVGDGHICIPMCIGLYALFAPIPMPASFTLGVVLLTGAGIVHLVLIGFWRRLPRVMAAFLILAYSVFVYKGFLN